MTQVSKTCEQRIDRELRDRLAELLPPVERWGARKCARFLSSQGQPTQSTDLSELRVEALDRIQEQAADMLLSVETIRTYKLCLSYGGPADYFELDYSKANGWIGGRYLFQDWFDCASREISAAVAERLGELFGIYPDAP